MTCMKTHSSSFGAHRRIVWVRQMSVEKSDRVDATAAGFTEAMVEGSLTKLSKKSAVTVAIHYALGRWTQLLSYRDDGRIEIDNNAGERALRAVALGRKNYLFAGSDIG